MEGNQMKMREAVEAALAELDKFGQCHDGRIHFADIYHIGNARAMLQAALSAPPRQCDVGTAEEQIKRWEEFCLKHHEYWKPSKGLTAIQRCNCPCYEGNGCNYFIWAQTPYSEGDK